MTGSEAFAEPLDQSDCPLSGGKAVKAPPGPGLPGDEASGGEGSVVAAEAASLGFVPPFRKTVWGFRPLSPGTHAERVRHGPTPGFGTPCWSPSLAGSSVGLRPRVRGPSVVHGVLRDEQLRNWGDTTWAFLNQDGARFLGAPHSWDQTGYQVLWLLCLNWGPW